MSTTTLTEQLSLRLTPGQREYLRDQATTLMGGNPPIRVTESDIMRVLINRAIQDDVYLYSREFADE
jgi:hypothetical protein